MEQTLQKDHNSHMIYLCVCVRERKREFVCVSLQNVSQDHEEVTALSHVNTPMRVCACVLCLSYVYASVCALLYDRLAVLPPLRV